MTPAHCLAKARSIGWSRGPSGRPKAFWARASWFGNRQGQLHRTSRDKPENQEPEKPAERHHDAEDSASTGVEWERQPLRIPEYGAAFRESLKQHPRQAAAAALALAGRLAAGDPSVWNTVRALKLRPGTLRARVAGDYRLLFEIGPGVALRLVDFILRRDLDRWLTVAGR